MSLGLGLAAGGVAFALYLLFLVGLLLVGRRAEARAVGGFVPDCVVFLRRLLADERLNRSRKIALVALLGYLASPIDLIPDFIPVAGLLDDAILIVLVLRFVLPGSGAELVESRWPGDVRGARLINRLALGPEDAGPSFGE